MPTKLLNCGAIVLIDDEDYDLVETRSWHVYDIRPSMRPAVAATERRHNRMFRVMLHRLIAVRMNPDLLKKRFRATPKNGNYLDCRRENIDVRMAKKGRGRYKTEPRPKGWERTPVKRPKLDQPDASPVWAGGFEFKEINRVYKGEGYRVRKCIGGKPVD